MGAYLRSGNEGAVVVVVFEEESKDFWRTGEGGLRSSAVSV